MNDTATTRAGHAYLTEGGRTTSRNGREHESCERGLLPSPTSPILAVPPDCHKAKIAAEFRPAFKVVVHHSESCRSITYYNCASCASDDYAASRAASARADAPVEVALADLRNGSIVNICRVPEHAEAAR